MTLRSFGELQRCLERMGKEADAAVVRALRDAARFGVAAALRSSVKTLPRPKASGTYEGSFIKTDVQRGAVVSNTAAHSIFVELGRNPGRRPPYNAILEWVYQKRLAKRPRGSKVRREKKEKSKEESPNKDKTKKERKAAKPTGGKKKINDVHAFVEAVRWKIAKRGITERPVMEKAIPVIAKRSIRETKKAIRKVLANPPR